MQGLNAFISPHLLFETKINGTIPSTLFEVSKPLNDSGRVLFQTRLALLCVFTASDRD